MKFIDFVAHVSAIAIAVTLYIQHQDLYIPADILLVALAYYWMGRNHAFKKTQEIFSRSHKNDE